MYLLLKNTFISYNNNNLQQIRYVLELPPVNIFWNICPIVSDILRKNFLTTYCGI
jgi:hypothetical protein